MQGGLSVVGWGWLEGGRGGVHDIMRGHVVGEREEG